MTYTAYHSLHTAARIRAGDWCLFHSAAGPIGIMLAQIAKEAGGHVVGLCSARKFDYARPYGFDHLVDYAEADWDKKVMEATKGAGVDVIVDGNQGPQAEKNYEVIAPGGHIIYIGATAGAPAADVSPRKLIYKSAFMGGFNLTVLEKRRGDARDNALVLDRIRTGRWKVPISDVVELEDVPELHRRFARRELKGRVAIRVGGELNFKS
jgi:NADPH2:quinone reductase